MSGPVGEPGPVRTGARAAEGAAPGVRDGRTRRRYERRDAIYRAAIELFVKLGYEETMMEAIAERAQTSRATVFNHFGRKIAFLEEWTARRRADAWEAARQGQCAGDGVAGFLRRYVAQIAERSETDREETVALFGAALRSINVLDNLALGSALGGIVEDAQRRGEVRAEVDATQAGVLLSAGYLAVLTQWIGREPGEFDLAGELRKVLDMFLHGILTPDAAAED
ncbi:TetR/AcrR family transcriptional regulator [Streptomyces sp. ODS28]|uniref:TetR/AcrR family transcriptional regulator n=1 Tax=Streptomyces sp. ODS28 TaxID=3136688 RepID=UPI0031E63D9F